jgi:hypothetical protein
VTRGKRLVLEGSRADMGCWRWSSWSWLGRFDSASSVAGGCSQPGSNGNTAGMGFELRDVINLCSGSVSVDELRWRLAGAWAVVRVMLTRYGATRLPSSRVSSLSSPRRPCSWPSYSRSSPSFVWNITLVGKEILARVLCEVIIYQCIDNLYGLNKHSRD